MRYISSDTNIWIDFAQINRLELPFALEYTYCMSSDAIADELISPPDIGSRLTALGLHSLDITDAEYALVLKYGVEYHKLSVYDRIAMAIAKLRGYILLSGDGALRRTATKEGIEVRGTLWVFDQLLASGKISRDEYRAAMIDLRDDSSGRIRLPKDEIRKRLNR